MTFCICSSKSLWPSIDTNLFNFINRGPVPCGCHGRVSSKHETQCLLCVGHQFSYHRRFAVAIYGACHLHCTIARGIEVGVTDTKWVYILLRNILAHL